MIFSYSFRNAYRAEIASFLVPVQGDSAANERIRERIEFVSNILFLIEDLYLTVGPGYMTSQSSVRVNVRSPLYWVRNQLASHVKDLMITKRTGWQVLKNLKNQVRFSFHSYVLPHISILIVNFSFLLDYELAISIRLLSSNNF